MTPEQPGSTPERFVTFIPTTSAQRNYETPIVGEGGRIMGRRLVYESTSSFTMFTRSVDTFAQTLAQRYSITDPDDVYVIQAGLEAVWKQQEAERVQHQQVSEAKDAAKAARRASRARVLVRARPNGTKFVYTGGVGISMPRLFAETCTQLTVAASEQDALQQVLGQAAISIIGLEQRGGGITRQGELLKPQDLKLRAGETYVPSLRDLELSDELKAELAQRQVMLKYRDKWVEQWGFDPKKYLPKGSKAASMILVTPGMIPQAAREAQRRLGRDGEFYSPWTKLEEEAYQNLIRGLFTAHDLPLLVSPQAIINSARETAKFRIGDRRRTITSARVMAKGLHLV